MKKYSVKQTTERRISASLRIALALLLLLLNIGAVFALTYLLQTRATQIFVALEVVALVVVINLQSSQVSASYKLAWTLLIVTLPGAGLILYLLWGGNIQSKRLDLLPVKAPTSRDSERRRSDLELEKMTATLPNWARAVRMLDRRHFLLYRDTAVTYFPTGADYFADVMLKLEKAERFIFLEYFILAEGKLWDRVLEVLTQKARAGVEIKIIFDDFGNITRMRSETIAAMREAGMEVLIFNPVHRYVNRLYFNYRDHRKILVVDGQYAYTGGINIGDEYVGIMRRFGEWKDTGILLDGPGAWGLTSQFLHMWEMMGSSLPNEHDYYRPLEERRSAGWVQPFSDGPINNPDNPAEDVFLQCITNAHRYIWITTPYLAVEDSIVQALCMAADSGVDVRLLLPGIPDKRYTFAVAHSHYQRLLEHGIRLYEFTPGFLHAKSFVSDDEVGMVGTINMDYRSFQMHYECGVMLYGAPVLTDLKADMEAVMARSAAVELESWKKRPWRSRATEKLLRIFSIWM